MLPTSSCRRTTFGSVRSTNTSYGTLPSISGMWSGSLWKASQIPARRAAAPAVLKRPAHSRQSSSVPSFTGETSGTLDDWREWADRFNTAGAAARRAGIWLAFHNEPDHMPLIDGKVPYDVFVERTDPKVVRLQLDVGNMVMGGGDPFAYLQRYRDRYWSFHLKDVIPDRSHDTVL